MTILVIHEGAVIIVDDAADFNDYAMEKIAVAKLASLEAHIERIRIDELPETPRATNCIVKTNEPCNCPDGRARGPPGFMLDCSNI